MFPRSASGKPHVVGHADLATHRDDRTGVRETIQKIAVLRRLEEDQATVTPQINTIEADRGVKQADGDITGFGATGMEVGEARRSEHGVRPSLNIGIGIAFEV